MLTEDELDDLYLPGRPDSHHAPAYIKAFARAVIAAYEAKLREQKPPIAWMMCGDTEGSDLSDEAFSWDKDTSTGHVIPVFTNPAPSAPGSPFTAGEDNDGWYVEFEGDQIAYGLTEEKANHIVSNYNAPRAPKGVTKP